MAFEISKERYASFGVATKLPHEFFDTFWDILGNYLKGVDPIKSIISFRLTEKKAALTIYYQNRKQKTAIAFDYNHPYDPFFPNIVYLIDQSGAETLLLPHELD